MNARGGRSHLAEVQVVTKKATRETGEGGKAAMTQDLMGKKQLELKEKGCSDEPDG